MKMEDGVRSIEDGRWGQVYLVDMAYNLPQEFRN